MRNWIWKLALVDAFVANAVACTTKHVAPPATPDRRVPQVDVEPPPETPGQGRLAIDTVGGPARVDEVLAVDAWKGTYVAGMSIRTRPICTAPCVVSLPFGSYRMRFTSPDGARESVTDNVVVGSKPSVYRYALGRTTHHRGKWLAGVSLFSFGLPFAAASPLFYKISDGAGTVTLLGGITATVAGLILWSQGRTEIQDGAGTQWSPSDNAIYVTR